MGIFTKKNNNTTMTTYYKQIVDRGEGFYSYDGKLYQSDIVRSCLRPKVQAVGKAVGKHLRDTKVNPEVYLRFILEEPNPLMSGQMLQEKLASQLMLNGNAFALIQRDPNGLINGIYPINSTSVRALKNSRGELHLEFLMAGGQNYIFKYKDIIHLRRDFSESDIFGSSPANALTSLMEVINTTDQGIVKAIKNSNVVKWLLKFHTSLRDEDIKRYTKEFVKSYLSVDSESAGAAATDSKYDAQQVEPKSYVPESEQTRNTVGRIYSFFNTNEKIIQSAYSENEWIAYYEAEIEPVIIQLSNEYTRKIFTRKERGFGNKIMFESSNLNFASMQTKLNLVQFVDRGIMSPNEVREILNMGPAPDGDKYIRRLDTAEIGRGENEDDTD